MGEPAKRGATYADLCAVPGHLVAEIINGVLHTNPRPAVPHARASTRLTGALDGPFDRGIGGPGGWVILDEPELHLHGDVYVPDLAGWRRERMPEVPQTAALSLAPDWICEVLSPKTAVVDRTEKMPAHAREGVAFAWLVDPLLRTLEAYVLERESWVQLGTWKDDASVNAKPFAEVALDLGALWAR